MSEFEDLDAAFERAALSAQLLPPGEYAVRACAAVQRKSLKKGTLGLKLRLHIERGPNAQRGLDLDLWFVEGEGARITAESLDILGLSGLKPSQILGLKDWSHLPWAWARVEHEVWSGRTFLNVRSLRRPDEAYPEPSA